MRQRLSLITIFVLLWASWTLPIEKAYLEQWFDSYECLPWEEEKLRLDNLSVYLSQNQKMIGYIAFYPAKDSKMVDFEVRMERVKDHLIRVRSIDLNRIITVKMGAVEKTKTILQPVAKDKSPPIFPK